jgi:hypothetical protein
MNDSNEFDALVKEVNKLRQELESIRRGSTEFTPSRLAEMAFGFSDSRLTFEFSRRRYENLFQRINTR